MSGLAKVGGYLAPPEQPKDWKFLDELLQPMHQEKIRWERKSPSAKEVSLKRGVTVSSSLHDPRGVLVTAFDDFSHFLASAGIGNAGPYPITIRQESFEVRESYRVSVEKGGCVIAAADTEGVRRALVYLEDEMLRARGPFLPLGVTKRVPVNRTRVVWNPPHFRHLGHEMLPEAYLNRIAHDGANAVWVGLESFCHGRIVPEFEHDPTAGFAKLRRWVEYYARYGVKLFLYSIQPAALPGDSPMLKKYPDIAGRMSNGYYYYCTSTETGKRLLTDALKRIFSEVSGLGGFVSICVGERPTHCYSAAPDKSVSGNGCPRCSKREPWEVLADTLAAMERGIHAGDPEAEFIAWPYTQSLIWGNALTIDAAAHIPPGVILMHNFEHAGMQKQLGKWRRADDYWLSYTGPSDVFRRCAIAAREHGTRMFAKLMVGASHELATVPHIPVPGHVYRKFKAAAELGVSGVYQNWGPGNYPGLMNRAAGDLSFTPLPESENKFLLHHARRDWGEHARSVVKAWKWFQKGYSNFPLTIVFSYFGPMHCGPSWPLYLIPRDRHLAGNWRAELPLGDRIGECTGYHTLEETIILSERMRDAWSKGVRLLEPLISCFEGNRERLQDIATAQALELHFESGVNILRFYALREEIAWNSAADRLKLLDEMKKLVHRELDVDRRLLPLTEAFPRLGFAPEASFFKYWPEMLRWRMGQLENLLAEEFPVVEQRIRDGKVPFPGYTGEEPEVKALTCRRLASRPKWDGKPVGGVWDSLAPAAEFAGPKQAQTRRMTQWTAGHDGKAIYFGVFCKEPNMADLQMSAPDRGATWTDDRLWITVETSQFKPTVKFMVSANGARERLEHRGMNAIDPRGGQELHQYRAQDKFYRWTARVDRDAEGWSVFLRIPFAALPVGKFDGRPIRVNVGRDAGKPEAREHSAWVTPDPKEDKLEMGWLIFE